ncbi:MAG: CHAT domain-containing protein, partial [Streptomyces sp.]|nr:CHAT domain-containing protein [Streptomyces sp.]
GGSLGTLAALMDDPELLVQAAQACRAAAATVRTDAPERAAILSNLCAVLSQLAERNGEEDLLRAAVAAGREAAAGTPPGHPRRAAMLANLGTALHGLADLEGDDDLGTQAVRCDTQIAEDARAPVFERVRAYLRLAWRSRDPEARLRAAESAVELLPILASPSLNRRDRQHQLRRLQIVASRAAAAAVGADRPGRAVELLEQVRGILIADTLNARAGDLAALHDRAPHLAEEFFSLQARRSQVEAGDGSDLALERAGLHTRWYEVLLRIRATDGMDHFLRSPDLADLTKSLTGGSFVFVYADEIRCDALVVTAGADVTVVPLPDLTPAAVDTQVKRFLEASGRAYGDGGHRERAAAQAEMLDVLGWAWDAVTGPVLTALGHVATPSDAASWPRVWWCPIGTFGYLPLHASGHHRDVADGAECPRTVLDRVVSSTLTTLRSLAHARSSGPPTATAPLVVAVPDLAGAEPLPGARAETREVAELLTGSEILTDPTRDAVLDALPNRMVTHLACHAYVGIDDPSTGFLVLPDYERAPLTVADLSALRLECGLAYLSACTTATAAPGLPDQAIHLTGALHLAGYQQVIGTMWPLDDSVGRAAATDFYRHLTDGGRVPPDIGRSSWALHLVTRRLRARFPKAPLLWASLTHTGI